MSEHGIQKFGQGPVKVLERNEFWYNIANPRNITER